MKKIEEINVVFTRHQLTEAQQEFRPGQLHVAADLALINITSIKESQQILTKLLGRLPEATMIRLYGVIPSAIRHVLFSADVSNSDPAVWYCEECVKVLTYESFNIQRSLEGEKPTFLHKEWLLTGHYLIDRTGYWTKEE